MSVIDNTTCTVTGDPDILGLGVRLGFYFQWLSVAMLLTVNHEEVMTSITVMGMLSVGILIALMHSIATGVPPGGMAPAMYFPFLELMVIAFIPRLTLAMVGLGKKPGWTQLLVSLRFMVWGAFTIWFWTAGVMRPNPCGAPSAFVYANVDGSSGARIFLALQSVLLIGIGVLLICFLIAIRYFQENSRVLTISEWLKRGVGWGPLALGIYALSLSIIPIELTIGWNSIRFDPPLLSSNGQIIPLTIGVMSLIRSIYLLSRHLWKARQQPQGRLDVDEAVREGEELNTMLPGVK